MRNLRICAAMLAIIIAVPAMAQETAPGRYTMTPTPEGMLRLDTRTGAVSLCSNDSGAWTCKSMPDDRVALENEIDRLSEENAQLRAELGKPAGEGENKPDHTGRERQDSRRWLPNDQDVEEFMTFFEKMMRRFKEFVETLQQDETQKQL